MYCMPSLSCSDLSTTDVNPRCGIDCIIMATAYLQTLLVGMKLWRNTAHL